MSPITEDYYALLGISPQATPDEVRKAARKRRAEVHPDRCGESSLEFAQRVNAAADVLSDPEARKSYDAECGLRDGFHDAEHEEDPFAAFSFAGASATWADPWSIGEEVSPWDALFEVSNLSEPLRPSRSSSSGAASATLSMP